MRHALLAATVVLLAFSPVVAAVDAIGTILWIDAERCESTGPLPVRRCVLAMRAGGQNRQVRIEKDVRVLDRDGRPLPGGLASPELKAGAEITVTLEGAEHFVTVIRLGRAVSTYDRPSFGLTPITEMTAADRYRGEDGGLYGAGRNNPPPAHLQAAVRETARIAPLGADGTPAADGTIALLSIGIGPNARLGAAMQEFSYFKQAADTDPMKSPRVAIVDGAQGAQGMAQWADARGRAWVEADRRLRAAGVSRQQVQVVWVKLANLQPDGELTHHGRALQRDAAAALQNARARFPNLRIAYLGSPIYAGWTMIPLNPEPYAYEGAFVARWLIQDQINGNSDLNVDPANGAVRAPLLLWGPYLWADGTTPRKTDGLTYVRQDLLEDGTHPSDSGGRKVANMLMAFFRTDPLARTWYVRN
jgi:hypothetical protein